MKRDTKDGGELREPVSESREVGAPLQLDLARIDTPAASEEGFEIELKWNGQPCGWFVTVLGEHARSVKAWQLGVGNKFRIRDWKAQKDAQRGHRPDRNLAPPAPMTEEDLDLSLRGAAVRTCKFRGVVFNGNEFPYSPENAYELVRRNPPWADDILEASLEIENFTKMRSVT